jgi:DHA1 family multidrug resistance protein-like MFS transporter
MNVERRNLLILTFVLFVVMLGYGIIIPIFPFYIENMGAGGMELGLLAASYAVMRLIFGPLWGGVSDRVGRKPVLLIGIAGYVITMVWFGLATQLWMLFAARILAGILSSATAPTTMAYIGDNTAEEERSGGMGMLGAAGGIGTILGPVLGGYLGGETLALPFFVAAGLALLSLLLAALFLPESTAGPAAPEGEPIVDLRAWWGAVRGPVGSLFVLTFISTCGLMIFANVFGLYALERFGYGTAEVGWIMMALGVVAALGQGVLAGPAGKQFGEPAVVKFGLLVAAISFGLLLLADNLVTILLATALLGLAVSLQSPALQALTSSRAQQPQGIVMGLSNSFVSLGRIVGPLVGGILLDVHLGLPYLTGALVMLIAFGLSLNWLREIPALAEAQ